MASSQARSARLSQRVRGAARIARVALGDVVARLRPARPYRALSIALAGALPDLPADSPAAWLRGPGRDLDLLTLQAVLRSAREDERLGLILVEIDALHAGWGRIQSLRRALGAVRAAGKRVWAYLPQPGMHEYYLASVADRVFLAPAARFEAIGVAAEVVFLKDALDRLGIEAQVARAGRFKSAGEPLTRRDMSPEHRAMVNGLLDDLYGQLVADVAAGRRLDEQAVRAAFDDGPLLAPEALGRGLVDALAYPDEVDAEREERFGDTAPLEVGEYRRRRAHAMRRAALGATPIGLVGVDGPIALGSVRRGWRGPRGGSWRTFRRRLDAMARDERLAAIVLRVDSPGGSGLASDLMWREIARARRRKPVVVSMGDVAASGGYYLATAADDVTAERGTLTGSIGVLSVKPVLRGLYERLGVGKELVVRGGAARASDWVRLDERELERLRAEADAFYETFLDRVAAGRALDRAAVAAVAEGRVWTGRQALEHGLVDRLGGLEEALDDLRRRLGLSPASRFAIEHRRPERRLWQRALGWGGADVRALGPLDALAPLAEGERVLASMPVLLTFARAGLATLLDDVVAGVRRGLGADDAAVAGDRSRAPARFRLFRDPPIVL